MVFIHKLYSGLVEMGEAERVSVVGSCQKDRWLVMEVGRAKWIVM
jgi:hypothetical protein